jgi:NTE family protein
MLYWVCLVIVLSSACRSPAPLNRPIEVPGSYRFGDEMTLASPERSGRILLAITFSGGGTRAAAFSYGVLRELKETRIRLDGRSRPLLDEIDLVSSVSGGSFTAAYFGLHGYGIFDTYAEVFLRRNVQRGLLLEVLRPRYWLGFLGVDRSQIAARYYDRKIFHEATFADLRRPGAPMIILNATDLSTAGRFSFTPMFFGLICSDLGSYPIADAVTASSAVPIVFPTVRLRSRVGSCDYQPPEWITTERGVGGSDLRSIVRDQIASQVESLDDREFIHLLDGGISDNLGLMNGIAAIAALGDVQQGTQSLGLEGVELILLITVNAEKETERPWDQLDNAASPFQVVSGLSGAQMSQNNRLVTQLARAAFTELARDLSTPEKPVRFRLVELGFENVQDSEERQYLRRIETSFNLSDTKVDRVIEAGRELVRRSPELESALELLGDPAGIP